MNRAAQAPRGARVREYAYQVGTIHLRLSEARIPGGATRDAMKLSGRFLNPPFSPGNVSRTGATKVTPRVSGGTSRPATPIARRARFRRREKVEDVVVDDTFDHVERDKVDQH